MPKYLANLLRWVINRRTRTWVRTTYADYLEAGYNPGQAALLTHKAADKKYGKDQWKENNNG